MSEPEATAAPRPPTAPSSRHGTSSMTGGAWAGWVLFAATMCVLTGAFGIIVGIVALVRGTVLVSGTTNLLVFDLTGWGWVHVIIGILLIVVGLGLFRANPIARVAAVVLAGINAIAQLAFLPVYPLWALAIIALDVVVIWAVLVHGDEVTLP